MKTCMMRVLGGGKSLLMASLISPCGSPTGETVGQFENFFLGTGRSMAMPSLGSTSNTAAFDGGAGVTNQGLSTQILGDMGTTGASTIITGFHSPVFIYGESPLNVGTVLGNVYTNAPQGSVEDFENAKAIAADTLFFFNNLASRPHGYDPGAGQLGSRTLAPGVYKSPGGPFLLTDSDLTLDAQGKPDALWIFQRGSSLTVGTPISPQSVILTNGAQAQNVYWQVGSAATIKGSAGETVLNTVVNSKVTPWVVPVEVPVDSPITITHRGDGDYFYP